MQSSRKHPIPIPHRQQRDGVLMPVPLNAPAYHDPQLAHAGYNDMNLSPQLDDDVWGVFDIDIDELKAGCSGTHEWTRPPVLPNNAFCSPQTTWQGTIGHGVRMQLDSETYSPLVPPSQPQFMNQNRSADFRVQLPSVGDGEVWFGSNAHAGQPVQSPGSPYTRTSGFRNQESLQLSQIPSLVTDRSLDNLSWTNSFDVPEIYGASQWIGISPFALGFENCETSDNAAPTARAHQAASPDSRSVDIESQNETSPLDTNEVSCAHLPLWFSYGNQDTQQQGISNFIERMPFLQDGLDISYFNSTSNHPGSQLFGSISQTQIEPSFGVTYNIQGASISPSSVAPAPASNLGQASSISIIARQLSQSSQSFTQDTTNSIANSMVSDNLPPALPISREAHRHLTYGNTIRMNSELAPQNSCHSPNPAAFEAYELDNANLDDVMEGIEANYKCFVPESGRGRTVLPPSAREKGKRVGHLRPEVAQRTATRRKEGKTCLRCRVARTPCDGQDPCGRCQRLKKPAMLESPCIKANFVEIVKSGTCNYVSQRNINHFNLDETYRVKMTLPETFDVNDCLGLLNSRKRRFNIRARQASGSLYVLDLAKCYDFLKKLPQGSHNGGLRVFIDDTLVNTDPWHQCVKEVDPTKNKTLLLSQWNNMPSRASYDLVPLDPNAPERPLDPEDDNDRQEIVLAAQLSRIICRKLELSGYAALQSLINNTRTHNSTSAERLKILHQLGKILLSLRWRMAWWQLLGDGSGEGDVFRDRFVHRVQELTRTLYFYYFALKKGIGSWVDLGALEGVLSMYPDSEPIWEGLPVVQSVEGFEAWLERGSELIKEANVERRFSV